MPLLLNPFILLSSIFIGCLAPPILPQEHHSSFILFLFPFLIPGIVRKVCAKGPYPSFLTLCKEINIMDYCCNNGNDDDIR